VQADAVELASATNTRKRSSSLSPSHHGFIFQHSRLYVDRLIRINTLNAQLFHPTAQNRIFARLPRRRPQQAAHTMLIPRSLLLRSPLLQQLPRSQLCHCPTTLTPHLSASSSSPSPILSFCRTKVTISQILRGARKPPQRKRIEKPEAPDLKRNPFKKAVVQKIFIVKPKVPLPPNWLLICALGSMVLGDDAYGRNPIQHKEK
jgi:hypothetical protein